MSEALRPHEAAEIVLNHYHTKETDEVWMAVGARWFHFFRARGSVSAAGPLAQNGNNG